MEITCIMCPRGCALNVENKEGKIEVSGNACPRGAVYGEKEVTSPERMLTTIKKYQYRTITLKSNKSVPKQKVFDCLREIKRAKISITPQIGDVLIENILDTGCDIIVTGISK